MVSVLNLYWYKLILKGLGRALAEAGYGTAQKDSSDLDKYESNLEMKHKKLKRN